MYSLQRGMPGQRLGVSDNPSERPKLQRDYEFNAASSYPLKKHNRRISRFMGLHVLSINFTKESLLTINKLNYPSSTSWIAW